MYYINLSNSFDKRITFKTQKKAAEEIGIREETLCRILSGKLGTTKTTAYCIVKHYDKNAEILDYFTYEGE